MQRVRIGLMGLAVVFLLVLLAAAFFGVASGGDDVLRPGGPTRSASADPSGGAADPREPLAELGVAPGGATEVGNIAAPDVGPVTIVPPPAPVLAPAPGRAVPAR